MNPNRKYRGWQMNTKDTKEEIKDSIKYFISVYGKPPAIVEYSNKLEAPEPIGSIEFKGINIPANILLLGE